MSILSSYLVTSQRLRPFDPRDDDDPLEDYSGWGYILQGQYDKRKEPKKARLYLGRGDNYL